MITCKRTNANDAGFINLVKALDQELAVRDGEEHGFYHQFNSITQIKYAVVAYVNDEPVGCGAIKEFDSIAMEVKRMFVQPQHRGKGIAIAILNELELWAKELGFIKTVLETGKKQPEAIGLYCKLGYNITTNYGQYIGVENSICFEKLL